MQHIGLILALESARGKQMIPLVAIGRRAIWRLFYVLVQKKQLLFHENIRAAGPMLVFNQFPTWSFAI
jgi:hypothetical protein